jgi:hypothetical protein
MDTRNGSGDDLSRRPPAQEATGNAEIDDLCVGLSSRDFSCS